MKREIVNSFEETLARIDFGERDKQALGQILTERMVVTDGFMHILEKYETRDLIHLRFICHSMSRPNDHLVTQIQMFERPDKQLLLPRQVYKDCSVSITKHPISPVLAISLVLPSISMDIVLVSSQDSLSSLPSNFYKLDITYKITRLAFCRAWTSHVVILNSNNSLSIFNVWENLSQPVKQIDLRQAGVDATRNITINQTRPEYLGIVVLSSYGQIFQLRIDYNNFDLVKIVQVRMSEQSFTGDLQGVAIFAWEGHTFVLVSALATATIRNHIGQYDHVNNQLKYVCTIPVTTPFDLKSIGAPKSVPLHQVLCYGCPLFILSGNKILSISLKKSGKSTDIIPVIHIQIQNFHNTAYIGRITNQLIIIFKTDKIQVRVFSMMGISLGNQASQSSKTCLQISNESSRLDKLRQEIVSRFNKIQSEKQLSDVVCWVSIILQKQTRNLTQLLEQNRKLEANCSQFIQADSLLKSLRQVSQRITYLQGEVRVVPMYDHPLKVIVDQTQTLSCVVANHSEQFSDDYKPRAMQLVRDVQTLESKLSV